MAPFRLLGEGSGKGDGGSEVPSQVCGVVLSLERNRDNEDDEDSEAIGPEAARPLCGAGASPLTPDSEASSLLPSGSCFPPLAHSSRWLQRVLAMSVAVGQGGDRGLPRYQESPPCLALTWHIAGGSIIIQVEE